MSRHRTLSLLVFGFSTACAHGGDLAASMDDQVAIEEVVTNVAHHIDGRDWGALRNLFADPIETDYTSLFGGEAQRQPADDLMATWKGLLTPVVTQHQLGPITVQVSGNKATARCHVRGYHYFEKAPGGDRWMVAGHYIFQLEKMPGGWAIHRMTLETFYQTGNQKLLQEAAGAGSS